MTRSEIFRSKMKLEAEKRKKQDSQQSLLARVDLERAEKNASKYESRNGKSILGQCKYNTDVGIDKEKNIGKEPGE